MRHPHYKQSVEFLARLSAPVFVGADDLSSLVHFTVNVEYIPEGVPEQYLARTYNSTCLSSSTDTLD